MGLWIYVTATGDILSNSRIIVDSSGSIKIPLESPLEVTSSETLSSPSFSMWICLSFTSAFNNPAITTTLKIYNNNNLVASSTYNTVIYRDQANQNIKIGGSSASYFKGFIYSYQLWNVAIFDFTTQLDEICGSGLLANCLWASDINDYFDSTYKNCDTGCSLGCTRTGSCNICDDPLCSVCTGFDANKCTTCVSHAHNTPCSCDSGSSLSSDGFSCIPCFTGCSSCSSSQYYQCSACVSSYYLLNVLCDTQCPSGYSQNSGVNSFFYLQNLESYEWNHIAFTAEHKNTKQTKMAFYLNGVTDHESDIGSDYFKDTKTDMTFTLGAEKDLSGYKNYFKWFIYDIKGYNSVKNISSLVLPAAQCTEACKACFTNGICIPNCLISQYWIGPEYNKCSKCSTGCLSCRDSSAFCNLCDNQKCSSCYDFEAESCLKCVSGTSNTANCQCDYGLAWNSSSGMCETCHQWQFKENDSCYDCPPLCAQCDSENKCTWCINNAVLSSGSCICSPGYTGASTCTIIPLMLLSPSTKIIPWFWPSVMS
ncbi:unnamed protein product [Blepharisma stoltei]|uniref:Uncharacterized protein n=1 Tax=Blepharisma stoltei TaxID=1481888 RepID=A0AAU9IEX5_9CILI|nr:unnamed protein product [Blepharisma stoltei]